MAWVEQSRYGVFSVSFRFGTRRLKKSLKTKNRREADAQRARLEENLQLAERGLLVVPEGADVGTFLLTDGRIGVTPTQSEEIRLLTLSELFQEYRDSLPEGAIEQNSLYTANIHMKHLQRIIGNQFDVSRLKLNTLQRYVNCRSAEKGRRGQPVSPTTIRKEITTFSGVWSWARKSEIIAFGFPNQGLRYPKEDDKPPFQTWEEIERQIDRGGLTDDEIGKLWDCLYLTLSEIKCVLTDVKRWARHEFIHPMIMTAAHTGARRGELIRAEIGDFDFSGGLIRIRERKRDRSRRTFRTVPMSPQLSEVLASWFSRHPGGRFAFCLSPARRVQRQKQLTADQAQDHFQRTLSGRWCRIKGWHVFRHSFISNCAAQGIDQRMIDAWSGHQTEEMRRRYTHLFPDQQQQALASVFREAG